MKKPISSRKIYVASSWRNQYYPEVVAKLREAGHEVYDFRNPPHGGNGFRWTDVDENAPNWTFEEYSEGLHHPLAECQFAADLEALQSADTCVLVLPCGRSAHTEAGWMAGAGKRVIVYIPEMVEPELMYKLFYAVTNDLDTLVTMLSEADDKPKPKHTPRKKYTAPDGTVYDSYQDYCNDPLLDSDLIQCKLSRGERTPQNDLERQLLREIRAAQRAGQVLEIYPE